MTGKNSGRCFIESEAPFAVFYTENQHQESEHLEKPHDYIITKEEISKKEVSSDQVSIDQSRPPHESSVEKCSDDGQMDGYMQEKKYIPKW